jgi:hypothetical protein
MLSSIFLYQEGYGLEVFAVQSRHSVWLMFPSHGGISLRRTIFIASSSDT